MLWTIGFMVTFTIGGMTAALVPPADFCCTTACS
jgi:heme/copper-type cytochrome/quinol oxidase subunit 1